MSAVLIDTNVLIYAQDGSEQAKQARAREVLLAVGDSAVFTTQVLAEYFSVVRCKFAVRFTVPALRAELERLAEGRVVLPVTVDVVLEAGRGVQEHGLSFYDAQIWAAARLNDIPVVLTEDFCHGRVIEGVRYVDPFCDDFDVSELE